MKEKAEDAKDASSDMYKSIMDRLDAMEGYLKDLAKTTTEKRKEDIRWRRDIEEEEETIPSMTDRNYDVKETIKDKGEDLGTYVSEHINSLRGFFTSLLTPRERATPEDDLDRPPLGDDRAVHRAETPAEILEGKG